MYSAFGVDHGGVEISKAKEKAGARLLGLTRQGAESLLGAAKKTVADSDNAKKSVKELGKPFVDNLSDRSSVHGAIEAGRSLGRRTKSNLLDDASRGGTKTTAQAAGEEAAKTPTGEAVSALDFKNVTESPANIFRGKKTTTTVRNPLTGTKTQTEREGSRFLKAKKTKQIDGGERIPYDGKEGGLTGEGKVVAVGGPAAAAGLGGLGLSERNKRKYQY